MFLETVFWGLYGLSGRAEWFDRLVVFTANPFAIAIIGLLFLLIFAYFDDRPGWRISVGTWKRAIAVGFAGFLGWFGAGFIKSLVHSSRPFVEYDITPLFYQPAFESFPSGHAMVFASLATAAFLVNKKLGIAYWIIAILIGLARIIAGVHYPLDTLAGWIFGAVIGGLIVIVLLPSLRRDASRPKGS